MLTQHMLQQVKSFMLLAGRLVVAALNTVKMQFLMAAFTLSELQVAGKDLASLLSSPLMFSPVP